MPDCLLGMLGRQLGQPVEGEERLPIHRVRHPGRSVLVEGGDPVSGSDEVLAALRRGGGHETQDRLLGGAVIAVCVSLANDVRGRLAR